MKAFKLGMCFGLALATAFAMGSDLVGKWTSHVEAVTQAPKGMTAKEFRQIKRRIAKEASVSRMELFRNGKYTMSSHWIGGPDQVDEGIWKVEGTMLSRTVLRIDGKPVTPPFTAHFTVENGGKKLTGVLFKDKAARTIFVRG